MKIAAIAPVLLLGVLMAGCGSESATKTVVTVVKEAQTVTAPAETVTTTAKPKTPASSSSDDSDNSGQGSVGSPSSGKIRVPNEVGKNHQTAQDDLQAHGLYMLAEEDATGQARALIFDRNWKVVSQSPAPGSMVSEDTTITLRSKKLTD